jgi:hypothetical protein
VNVILTGLIAGRLLYMGSRVTKNLGGQHAKTYTSIVSMTVESAFLYTSTAMAFLITFLLDSPAALAFCPIVSQTVVSHKLVRTVAEVLTCSPVYLAHAHHLARVGWSRLVSEHDPERLHRQRWFNDAQ